MRLNTTVIFILVIYSLPKDLRSQIKKIRSFVKLVYVILLPFLSMFLQTLLTKLRIVTYYHSKSQVPFKFLCISNTRMETDMVSVGHTGVKTVVGILQLFEY